MTKMIIVRHCQAEGNLKRYFQGTIDSDITETGAGQIARVAELLGNEPIDVIYSSPKKRAVMTAEGIDLYHHVGIRLDPELVEIDAGKWKGVPLSEIERIYPEHYDDWKNHPERFCVPDGESMAHVYERMKSAVIRIARENKDKTVCVVSHGCAIKNAMCFLHGFELDRISEIVIGKNTSVNVVLFDNDLIPTVKIENYEDHLQNTEAWSF